VLTGHSGATTFHAEDIMEVFMRMTGEAMGVSAEHLSAFLVLATIRRFEYGRRITSLTEVVWLRAYPYAAPGKIKIKEEEFGMINVGWYDPRTDTVEVDLRRSYWLQKLGGYDEIMERAKFLTALVQRGVFDAEKVGQAVMEYYRQKHALMRKA
jgi:flagellar protein FlaI